MSTAASFTNLRVVRETDETRPCRVYVRSGSRNVIASVNDDPETVALFQLFAAAPEMLEALKASLRHFGPHGADEDQYVIHTMRAAIAKAKGEQP